MKPALSGRSRTDGEGRALGDGRQSSAAFVLRRCQILLASADRPQVPANARALRCHRQTVRHALPAVTARGLAALVPRSSRPHTRPAAVAADRAEALRDRLPRSPRAFDPPTAVWTREPAAAVHCAEGLTATRVSDETIRATRARRTVRWRRAKQWLTSPDPRYAAPSGGATA